MSHNLEKIGLLDNAKKKKIKILAYTELLIPHTPQDKVGAYQG